MGGSANIPLKNERQPIQYCIDLNLTLLGLFGLHLQLVVYFLFYFVELKLKATWH